jgi:hypothetical protein
MVKALYWNDDRDDISFALIKESKIWLFLEAYVSVLFRESATTLPPGPSHAVGLFSSSLAFFTRLKAMKWENLIVNPRPPSPFLA